MIQQITSALRTAFADTAVAVYAAFDSAEAHRKKAPFLIVNAANVRQELPLHSEGQIQQPFSAEVTVSLFLPLEMDAGQMYTYFTEVMVAPLLTCGIVPAELSAPKGDVLLKKRCLEIKGKVQGYYLWQIAAGEEA